MPDVYGNISFARSKDCAVDLEAMKHFLNQFVWDAEDGFWEITDGGLIFEPDQEDVLYPDLSFALRLSDDGGDSSGPYLEEWSIAQVAAEMSRFISSGYVSMVCHGAIRGMAVTTTIFNLSSLGKAEYHKLTHYDLCDAFKFLESC